MSAQRPDVGRTPHPTPDVRIREEILRAFADFYGATLEGELAGDLAGVLFDRWKAAEEQARQAEREACAALCEEESRRYERLAETTSTLAGHAAWADRSMASAFCAAAIRSRGQTPGEESR